jgi:ABC-type antimicrobial peptide transport system permease subunit
MTFRTLIRRSLRFHARTHLGVVLGAAIGSAALIGALVVGDSARASLRQRALERVGGIELALAPPGRLFRAALADDWQRLCTNSHSGPTGGNFASVLRLPATATTASGDARANRVTLLGVNGSFDTLAGSRCYGGLAAESVLLNEALAAQLHARKGDTVLLRVQRPAAFSHEAAISSRGDSSVALRLRVAGVVSAADLGGFDLTAGSTVPLNAFVPLQTLQGRTGATNQANLLLSSSWQGDEALQRIWTLADLESRIQVLPGSETVELSSARIFLDPPMARAAALVGGGKGLLTYLANLLQAGTNSTPYSIITAAGPPYTPADMRDDEIIVNQWLADDLRVGPGDGIGMIWFAPDSGAQLLEITNRFRVHSIVPMKEPWSDRTLMPEFPGIEKAESTYDWDAGFPLVHPIRPKDEDYWKKYRGTPKAFVTLAAGQKMWANRFGNLTAIRFPVPASRVQGQAAADTFRQILEQKILASVNPADVGFSFQPVRAQALRAAAQGQDFGQLFLGFSFFLVAAALLLMALLFQFSVEQRAAEVGMFLALGFRPAQVRRMLLFEGAVLALAGGLAGALGGLGYAKVMLWGLATVWRSAVGASALEFHASFLTLAIGACASTFIAVVTIWLTLRKQARQPAIALLTGEFSSEPCRGQPKRPHFLIRSAESGVRNAVSDSLRCLLQGGSAIGIAVLAGVGAAGLIGWAIWRGDTANAESFFGAGTLLLIAGLGLAAGWLRWIDHGKAKPPQHGSADASSASFTSGPSRGRGVRAPMHCDGNAAGFTLGRLGLRGCARRRSRSLATIALLACGSFLIAAIGVFRLDASRDAGQRASGTGGFALWGESTLPVMHDLNTTSGREAFGLDAKDLAGVRVVPLRVRDGDEASCLNLNRAQKPRLLAVKPELLEGRFTFAQVAEGCDVMDGWRLLYRGRLDKSKAQSPKSKVAEVDQNLLTSAPAMNGEIPAIGDANSIQWAMGKKVGETIDYTDDRGRAFKLRLVGAVANSILQGNLLIDEAAFLEKFPNENGYRMFLLDVPASSTAQVSATLTRALQDVGLELAPAGRRLDAFNAVQNTYLGTFQIMGGLGLLLGSAGLGVVVLSNVLERRGELGLLAAVGFRRRTLQRLVLSEHAALLGLGLGLGLLAAAVAVLPALLSPGTRLPFASLGLTLGAVVVNGALWTWLATHYALRGNLLAALRNE